MPSAAICSKSPRLQARCVTPTQRVRCTVRVCAEALRQTFNTEQRWVYSGLAGGGGGGAGGGWSGCHTEEEPRLVVGSSNLFSSS